MKRHIEIEFAVALYTLRSPSTVVTPREVFDSERRAVIGPVYHVVGGVYSPFLHPEEVGSFFVMAGIDV